MVTIGRGAFTMGCPKGASMCKDDEKPAHRVQLSPYEIDVYEVTVGHYKGCIDAGACTYPVTELKGLHGASSRAAKLCRDQFRAELWKRPVVCIDYADATTYCKWRGKRLPTEAEWERAARGDSSKKDRGARLFPWGDQPANANLACVEADARCEVGSHPKGISPYGLHDMAGNAAEWVLDFYDPTFYASSPSRDPDGTWDLMPIQKQRCMSSTCYITRGGSWKDEPIALRATARTAKASSHNWAFASIGFRCARSTEKSRREYFANRMNMMNAKRFRDSQKRVPAP